MDGGFEVPEINLHKHMITSENIISLFDLYNVPLEMDYLSIDLDSIDIYIFKTVISSKKYRPRVIR